MIGFDQQQHVQTVSDSFDQDFGHSHDLTHSFGSHDLAHYDHSHHLVTTGDSFNHGNDIFHYQDPLKYSAQHQFQPLQLDIGHTHFVQPHEVNHYIRKDGTQVEGYYRDGDGNTNINHPLSQGGGYYSSNPDGNPFNNLK